LRWQSFARPPGRSPPFDRLHQLASAPRLFGFPMSPAPSSSLRIRLVIVFILSPAETASLRAIFPQIPLQLLGIQAIRGLAEVHKADRTRGQKPAFTEDL